jgi:DNA polymerase-1
MYRGRVYSTYMLHGTTSGRLASRNPNLQNIPRESIIRKQFVPAKARNVFVECDYAQAELRVLTWLAQDEYFRDVFNNGRDLFDELTPLLYPELGSKDKVPPPLWKETRIRVKAYVYGLAYGRSEFSIASEYKIPVAEARRGMEAFFEVIPDIVRFREETRKNVLAGSDLVTPFGRHRRFWLITDDNKKDVMNEALAFLPQSTSSDIALRAFTRIRPALRGRGFVRNIVHDSILAECSKSDVDEVGAILQAEMAKSGQELVGDYVRFETDVKVGASWGDV